MPDTLTTALTNVRSLIDEPVAQFWADSELTSWINQACDEVQRATEWKRKTSTISTTSGTQNYTGPSDFLRHYRLEFVPAGNTSYTYSLEFRGYNEMDAAWGNLKSLPSAYPEQFTIWLSPTSPNVSGIQLVLYPVPSVNGTLNLYYYCNVSHVAAGGDQLDIISGWEDMIYNFTAYRALRKDANPAAKEFQSDYQTQLETFKTMTRTYTDQANWFSTGQQNYNPLFLDLEA